MKSHASKTSPLWAVTSYFNPVGYRRRRENFRTFREQLTLPLAAIELSFNGQFELQPKDAEILIQIHGRDVMWQKERLLNVAFRALPDHCTQVAIVDCDVVFVRPDWAEALSRRLEVAPLVQPFSTVHYTPPDVPFHSPQALAGDYTRPSVGHLVEQGLTVEQILGNFTGRRPGSRSPGHAMAARRDFLQAHGLYDAAIIGGGDSLLVAAALGAFDILIREHAMNDAQAGYYLAWAERVQADVRSELGCLAGDLVHLWHGTMDDRRSPQRYHELRAFEFNPVEDIDVDATGCWRWNSDKPAMHAFLRDYFASRKEDGGESPTLGRAAVRLSAAA